MTDFQAIQQKYYEFAEMANNHFERLCPEIENYINALEEREKKMLDFIVSMYRVLPYNKNNTEQRIDKSLFKNVIESITGQSIEEVLKR